MCVLARDLVLDGGGQEDIAGLEKDLLRGHLRAAAGKIRERFLLPQDPIFYGWQIEAFFVIEPTVNIGEANDFVTCSVHERSCG